MNAQGKRYAIAAALQQALGTTWTVYAGPESTYTAPAAILSPRAPYRRPLTMTQELVSLQLTLLVPVASLNPLDLLDTAMDAVPAALELVASLEVQQLDSNTPGPVTQGGTEYLAATIDLAA